MEKDDDDDDDDVGAEGSNLGLAPGGRSGAAAASLSRDDGIFGSGLGELGAEDAGVEQTEEEKGAES